MTDNLRCCIAALALVVGFGGAPRAQESQAPRITRIEFRAASQEEGGGMIISLLGTGHCTYTLDFGDGKNEVRTAQLPDRVQHTYPADGEDEVVATPQEPCQGVARAKIEIRSIERGIWGINAESGPSAPALELLVTIRGRGTCTVTLTLATPIRRRSRPRCRRHARTGTPPPGAITSRLRPLRPAAVRRR